MEVFQPKWGVGSRYRTKIPRKRSFRGDLIYKRDKPLRVAYFFTYKRKFYDGFHNNIIALRGVLLKKHCIEKLNCSLSRLRKFVRGFLLKLVREFITCGRFTHQQKLYFVCPTAAIFDGCRRRTHDRIMINKAPGGQTNLWPSG